MNTRLGKRVSQAVARSKMNMREISAEAGLNYGWVRQVAAGGIARPNAARLAKLAVVVGIEPNELLALSDQLGAVDPDVDSSRPRDAVAAAIDRQTDAIESLVELLRSWRDEANGRADATTDVLGLIAGHLSSLAKPEGEAGSPHADAQSSNRGQ